VRRYGAAPALLALALGTSAPAPAQAPRPTATPPPLVFEADVYVVSVTAVVFDKSGRFVEGLTPKDVTLYEDDVPQQLTYLLAAQGGEEKIPLSVVLVLDASGSMKRNLHFLQEAASSFLSKLEDVDQALVVQFNESLKGSAEFTDDLGRLEQFVEALQAWGGTSLYDAVHYALDRVGSQPGRKAVIVFSDGADTTSSLREKDVIEYARAVEATVYSIGIEGMGPGGTPKGFLKRIASETGGEAFFPDKVGDLIRVFAEISAELHNHYALAYTPKRAPDGSYRKIRMTVDRENVEVRVRKGYYALKKRRR
jgi:Ca-activated chloride channel family protein